MKTYIVKNDFFFFFFLTFEFFIHQIILDKASQVPNKNIKQHIINNNKSAY